MATLRIDANAPLVRVNAASLYPNG